MPDAQQGHDFRGWYLHEDNGFASSPNDSTAKAFGANATIDTARGVNNAVQVFQPGSRVPDDIIEQAFEGSWEVSFVYTNPWWLNWFFGSPSSTDNGDGSHTHTFDGESMQSQRIGIGRETSGDERILKGCVATQATVTPQVGGLAQVRLQGAYAEEEIVTPASLTEQPTIDHEPMTFAEAAMSLGGSTIGYVQSGSVSIQNNVQLIRELGNRVAIDFSERTLIPSVDFSKINEAGGTDNLEELFGASDATTVQSDVETDQAMTLSLDNGDSAGSGINTVDFNLSGSFPEGYGEDGLGDPEADVTEEVNRLVEGISVEATNETSSAV